MKTSEQDSGLLQPGKAAPDFDYRDAAGNTRNTRNLQGQPYLVYFYPKDDTPGCTAEACSLRDAWDEYESAGVAVIGVSFDSEASHDRFRRRHRLPFGLAADADRKIARAFGVYQPTKLTHRLLPFARRVSFLVDKSGCISQTYPKVDLSRQARRVLDDVARLPD
ncbi:MAG: peroxiredoxin [Opitutales bacterium]